MQQHNGEWEKMNTQGRHTSKRESAKMKFMDIQMEYSKMRSEPSEYMWKTRDILIPLESHFEEHAQEVRDRKLDES